ncbi:STAS domain-containing protein [Streptomyces sp. NPDC087300]|uniref:STAS domain-containing protein n=1 Tax=Streptomyces sp. NPDC087300 TaxID=3365780 RepID=UPI00382A5D97
MARNLPFTVEAVDVLDTVLIHVSGEIDLQNIARLERELDSCDDRHCELDLSRVTFIDSTTLKVLLRHRRRAASRGGSLRLVDASPHVRRVLDITGTTSLFLASPDPGHPRS